MKTTWDELMRYAPEQEYSLPPLEDSEIKSSWLFSRLVDLNELSSITVDGVTYSLQ